MVNETPILSWGVENIDQPAIKQAVSGAYQGLSDTVSSVLAELQDRFSRPPVEVVAGPRRGGVISERGGYVPPVESPQPATAGRRIGVGETLEEGKRRVQAELEAGTYQPPTGASPGAGIANTLIEGARGLWGNKPQPEAASPIPQTVVQPSTPVASVVPTPVPTVAPTVASAAPPAETAPTGPVYKYIDSQGNMGLTNKPESIPPGSKIVPLAQGRGVSGGSASGGVERSEVTGPQSYLGLRKTMEENQPATPLTPGAEVDARIDTAIERIKASPGNLINVRGQLVLSPNALKEINELEKARVTAHTAREGHTQASADRQVQIAERKMANAENLAEHTRANKEREAQNTRILEETKANRQDTKEIRNRIHDDDLFQKAWTKASEDKASGEFNEGKGLFTLADQGLHANRPEVQRAYAPYLTAKRNAEQKKGSSLSPAEEKKLKENYFRAKGWME